MRLSVLFFASACSAACLAACESGDDPKPVSQFVTEEPAARSIYGRVLSGIQPVEGALVVVDPDPNLPSNQLLSGDLTAFPRSAATDRSGDYRLLISPSRYDLTVRRDREVFVYRELGGRFFSPQLGADQPAVGFKARIVPTTNPAPAPGNKLAFFVSGPDARALRAVDASSYEATFTSFDTSITLRAVEYPESAGLAGAVAQGKADLRVVDGKVVSAQVTMTPITFKVKVAFDAMPPPGFTLEPLVVDMDLGIRTDAHVVKKLANGADLEVSVVADARYAVTARSVRGQETSVSGRHFFGFDLPRIPLPLPGPISSEAPIDDEAPQAGASGTLAVPVLEANGVLSARVKVGALEHVLTPVGGDGATVHIVTSSRETSLPDVTRLGLARPTGRYTWTTEFFPEFGHVDQFTGPDVRVQPPSWKSAPRALLLR